MDTVEKITKWAGLVRDIGLILGVPTLLALGYSLQQQQLEVLKAQNEHLKSTQFDRVYALVDAQKKLYEHEAQVLSARLKSSEAENAEVRAKLLADRESALSNFSKIQEFQTTWKSDPLGPLTITIGPPLRHTGPKDKIEQFQFQVGTSF